MDTGRLRVTPGNWEEQGLILLIYPQTLVLEWLWGTSAWLGLFLGQEGVMLGGKGTPGRTELVLGIQSWEKQGSDVDGVAVSGGQRELATCVYLEVALSE